MNKQVHMFSYEKTSIEPRLSSSFSLLAVRKLLRLRENYIKAYMYMYAHLYFFFSAAAGAYPIIIIMNKSLLLIIY